MTTARFQGFAFLLAFALCIPAANWLIGNAGTICAPGGLCLIPVAPGIMAPSGVLMIGLAGQVIGKAWMVLAALPVLHWLRRRDERMGLA